LEGRSDAERHPQREQQHHSLSKFDRDLAGGVHRQEHLVRLPGERLRCGSQLRRIHPMMKRLHRDQEGVALIMALFVAFVVLMLSIYVIDQATHNQSRAAYDRKRLTAQNAAEAGINWWFNAVQNSPVQNLQLTP